MCYFFLSRTGSMCFSKAYILAGSQRSCSKYTIIHTYIKEKAF
uniref:Uncharacterized protein n=1 Tax=Arundo donax TaxID=35708 RepID=A0A0A8YLE0_ARUDO